MVNSSRVARTPRAVAVGTGVLDHHLVEPRLHPRVRLAALPVAAVVALDPPRDAAEADLLALPVVALDLRVGRREQRDLLRLDAVEDRVARRLGQLLPRRVEREARAPSTGCTSSGRPRCPGCT